jgi:hypothetical protein
MTCSFRFATRLFEAAGIKQFTGLVGNNKGFLLSVTLHRAWHGG